MLDGRLRTTCCWILWNEPLKPVALNQLVAPLEPRGLEKILIQRRKRCSILLQEVNLPCLTVDLRCMEIVRPRHCLQQS